MTQNFVGHRPLIAWEIPDEIDLLEAVTGILNDISDVKLQRIFRSWIERIERVIDAGGLLDLVNIGSLLSHSRSPPVWLF
jgi:hypothetical protein